MKSAKKTWVFSFRDDAMYWLERLPVTEIVEGEEFTLLSGPGKGETRVAKRMIKAALKERLVREGKILASGTGSRMTKKAKRSRSSSTRPMLRLHRKRSEEPRLRGATHSRGSSIIGL
jgi:hypothetical protein